MEIKTTSVFSWTQLAKPFLVLAPMEDVTDTVFRQIICQTARPDVFFTEFTNCDGLLSDGRDKVTQRLKYSQIEHPIIAQIWGTKPESFYQVSKILVRFGFDGVDINMGCPIKRITKTGGGGALINNSGLAKSIISATR